MSTIFALEFTVSMGPRISLRCWEGTFLEAFQEIEEVSLPSIYFHQSWPFATLLCTPAGINYSEPGISASPRQIVRQIRGIKDGSSGADS